MPAATPDDHEARLRRLEDIVARQDERNRNYEQLIHLVARQGELIAKHATSIEGLWGAIGQVKVKVGFLVAGVGLVAGIFSGVVSGIMNRALTPPAAQTGAPKAP